MTLVVFKWSRRPYRYYGKPLTMIRYRLIITVRLEGIANHKEASIRQLRFLLQADRSNDTERVPPIATADCPPHGYQLASRGNRWVTVRMFQSWEFRFRRTRG